MSEFHNTVYYENWTYGGEEHQSKHHEGTWKTYEQALHDMQNYSNTWGDPGSGWIVRVSVVSVGERVIVDRTTVYEKAR